MQSDINFYGKPSQEKQFYDKYHFIFCYYHTHNIKRAVIHLWINSYRIFKGAMIVDKFEDYQNLDLAHDAQIDFPKIWPFMEENLVAHIRIVTFFENYMKGVLMLNGYIAHKINKNKSLRKEQHIKPIKVSEVFNNLSFRSFNENDEKSWETTNKTVGFSSLINNQYQEVIKLPIDILSIITKMNNERNDLHFMSDMRYTSGESVVKMYQKIIDFAEQIVRPQFTELYNSVKKDAENHINKFIKP